MMISSPLEDICVLVTDGTHDSPKLKPTGVPFIKGKHISGGVVDFANCDFISREDHQEAIRRVKPQFGDILFSNIGSVGDTARVRTTREFSIKNVALFRANPAKADPEYLYYLVCSPSFRQEILSQRSGSAQPFISLANLRAYRVRYHASVALQRKIAAILSAYDDLIENNRRRIEILEEMAQALYREWFVDFRFPGHEAVRMVDSPLGMIPEGWEVRSTVEIVRRLPHGATYRRVDVQDDGLVKVIDQSSDSELGYHNSEPDHVGSSKDPIIVFGDHTCRMYLLIEPFSLGPNTVPFIPNTDVSSYYLYYVLRGLVETHEYKRHWTELCAKRVTLGPLALVQHFSGHAMLLHSEMVVLSRAQRNLRRIRDLLLPRLISGELDVSDLDIHGERVQ